MRKKLLSTKTTCYKCKKALAVKEIQADNWLSAFYLILNDGLAVCEECLCQWKSIRTRQKSDNYF